jgi:hypothetical protein
MLAARSSLSAPPSVGNDIPLSKITMDNRNLRESRSRDDMSECVLARASGKRRRTLDVNGSARLWWIATSNSALQTTANYFPDK